MGDSDQGDAMSAFYLRKVHGEHVFKTTQTLFFQFLFTFGCVCATVFSQTVHNFVRSNIFPMITLSIIGSIAMILVIVFSTNKTETQLAIFTFCETLGICAVTIFYGEDVVVLAMLATFGIVSGLGVYAATTQHDHTGWLASLTSSLCCLIFMGLLNLLFGLHVLYTIELYLGTLIFFGYIIVDIQTYLKRSVKLNYIQPDLHIEAALNIYLDVINIFLRLLKIIGTLKGDKKKRT